MSQRMLLTLRAFGAAPAAGGIVDQADVGVAKAALEATVRHLAAGITAEILHVDAGMHAVVGGMAELAE
jgi:enoyl-[acyl-carrier-protein] reductase (NADH)